MGHGRTGAFQNNHERCDGCAVSTVSAAKMASAHPAACAVKLHQRCPSFAAYYRGAMGILLVYSVNDEASFNNVRNWMKNIETHASSSVNKASAQIRA